MEELVYWVWLSQVFTYGSDLPRELLDHFESPRQLYDEREDNEFRFEFLHKKDVESIRKTSLERAQTIISDCERMRIKIIPFNSARYPKRLKDIFGAPMVLYVLGKIGNIDDELVLGIVGTRYPTTYGLFATERLASELAQVDFVIVSGCAVGIDYSAHIGAMKSGGRTIGVLGCGLDVDYPRENHEMKRQIIKTGGALITELPPKSQPVGKLFPIRNRIIAALSVGVLITEAPQRSGALITAEHALEQGKDVFCLPPHDIFDQRYSGVAKFIRDGAKCVCSAQDIMLEYMSDYPHRLSSEMIIKTFAVGATGKRNARINKANTGELPASKKAISEIAAPQISLPKEDIPWPDDFTDDHKKIYDLLTNTPQTVDDIVLKLETPISNIPYIFTELELEGLVESLAGNRFILK